MNTVVSIPHRYDKNLRYVWEWWLEWTLVSIPHRYDKNVEERTVFEWADWFQSLIGTIKTRAIRKAEYSFAISFQSLIGTIKTLPSDTEIFSPHVFQSLIGTIKTLMYLMKFLPSQSFNPS